MKKSPPAPTTAPNDSGMDMRLWPAILLFFVTAAVAGGDSPKPATVVVYPAASSFDEVIDNVKFAIINRGMLVSGTLHVSDMLNRTGKDLGFPTNVYRKAQSIEFCSALMSHRMIAADPRNLVICPFTVAVYETTDEPAKVYVAYHRQVLAGNAEEAARAVNRMLDGIAREAAE